MVQHSKQTQRGKVKMRRDVIERQVKEVKANPFLPREGNDWQGKVLCRVYFKEMRPVDHR